MESGLSESSTVELVAAAQSGDPLAFAALYQRFAKLVHAVVLAHAAREDASDLVQNAFLTALRTLRGLRDPTRFGAWIGAIARNEARMHHRRTRHDVPLPPDLMSSQSADDSLRADEILAAVRRLPERYRTPLLLRLVEGMGGEEIAARTGLTHGTIRVYLHQGIARLRSELGD